MQGTRCPSADTALAIHDAASRAAGQAGLPARDELVIFACAGVGASAGVSVGAGTEAPAHAAVAVERRKIRVSCRHRQKKDSSGPQAQAGDHGGFLKPALPAVHVQALRLLSQV